MPAQATAFLLLIIFVKLRAVVYCDGFDIVYYHVPKTGGSSIESMLLHQKVDGQGRVCRGVGGGAKSQPAALLEEQVHSKARSKKNYNIDAFAFDFAGNNNFMVSHYSNRDESWITEKDRIRLGIELNQDLSSYTAVASVRNPYTRVVSAYNWVLIDKSRKLAGWKDFSQDSFPEFMEWLSSSFKTGDVDWYDPSITHFRPCSFYTHDDHGNKIVDVVLHTENLDEETSEAFDKLLPHHTTTTELILDKKVNGKTTSCTGIHGCANQKEFQEFVEQSPHTKRTIEITNEIYADDFSKLGYKRFEMN